MNKMEDKRVLCKLRVNRILKYDNGDSCNVYCDVPDGTGVAFIIPNIEKLFIGQEIFAIKYSNHFEVLSFWDDNKEIHPFY